MNDCLLTHSISSSTKNNAQRFSHNSIQGHHHSNFDIVYCADSNQLRWSMTVGAYLDPRSPAARYAKGAVLKRGILGCGMLIGKKKWLIISDPHFPYEHRDMITHLKALDDYYDFDYVLCTGDMADNHSGSYHEAEPDALSPEDEYKACKASMWKLEELFPKMIVIMGNHSDIPKRKLKSAGLPASMVSDCNALYDLEGGWDWMDEYKFDSKGALPVLQPMTLKKNHRWDRKIIEL